VGELLEQTFLNNGAASMQTMISANCFFFKVPSHSVLIHLRFDTFAVGSLYLIKDSATAKPFKH
jgi:hypothetical protein